MRKIFLLLLIILVSILIYQHTPSYQYKVRKYIEKKEFEETKKLLGEVSKRIKAREKAIRKE